MLKIEVRYNRHIDRWQVIKGRDVRYSAPTTLSQHVTKEDAEERGRVEGRRLHKDTGQVVELVIKRQDGTIGERSTYGKDPRRRKG